MIGESRTRTRLLRSWAIVIAAGASYGATAGLGPVERQDPPIVDWEEAHGDAATDERPTGLLAHKSMVHAIGSSTDGQDSTRGFVRTYRAGNGQLAWSADFGGAPEGGYASDLAARGSTLFVGGHAGQGGQADVLVRAYAAKSGVVKWTVRLDVEGGLDGVNSMTVVGRRLFVAGTAQTSQFGFAWILVALDVDDGSTLWEERLELVADGVTTARTIAAASGRLLVAGWVERGFYSDLVVRAYRPRDGTVQWLARETAGDADLVPNAIVADARTVVVVGQAGGTGAQSSDGFVYGYSAPFGSRLWRRSIALGDRIGTATDVAIGGGEVIATGWDQAPVWTKAATHHFSTEGGVIRRDNRGTPQRNDEANAVTIGDGRIYVAGTRDSRFAIWAYGLLNNESLWQTRHRPEGGWSTAQYIDHHKGRIFAAGTDTIGFDDNLVVRAYESDS